MTELDVIKCTTAIGTNRIYLVYNESTLEVQKIVWYRTDFNHHCAPVLSLSDEYNLADIDMTIIDANTYEFALPTGLFLGTDSMGDLDPSGVIEYFRNR